MTENESRLETFVPDGAQRVRCPYCDRPFPNELLRDLHLGEEHETQLTEAEVEAYTTAREEESDVLFVLHLAIVGAIVVLFFAIAYLYAFVLI